MSKQSRRWCFTLNNYAADQREPPKQLVEASVWGLWAREVGESGTPHIQGYAFLHRKRTLQSVKLLISPRVHLEASRGTHAENRAYCTKGGDFSEFGTFPESEEEAGKAAGARLAADWEDWRLKAKAGEFENIPAKALIPHYGNFKRFHADAREAATDLPAGTIVGVWLHGPSGVGKSHLARELFAGPIYLKDPHTKWWDNYRSEDIVLLEDVHPDHAGVLASNLKLWADRYSFQPEVKGGCAGRIRPRHVVATSQYTIAEVFRDFRTRDAIQRRFDERLVDHWTSRRRGLDQGGRDDRGRHGPRSLGGEEVDPDLARLDGMPSSPETEALARLSLSGTEGEALVSPGLLGIASGDQTPAPRVLGADGQGPIDSFWSYIDQVETDREAGYRW